MATGRYVYLTEYDWNEIFSKVDALSSPCRLCPRCCNVNRLADEIGFCKSTSSIQVSSIFPHFGEEPPLCAQGGSGTIFFSHCTLTCVFCQNFQISHEGVGDSYTPQSLAQEMLTLQTLGCCNINFVTATQYLPNVLRALQKAATMGLELPIVYNCGGYESVEVVALLKSIVDIWLPDMKYATGEVAKKMSNAKDYPEINKLAIRAMISHEGALKTDKNGIATRGVCIRHLVLPNHLLESKKIFAFLSETFDPADITISLMAQYTPLHKAKNYNEINRTLLKAEYREIYELCIGYGFEGFYQEIESLNDTYVIDFNTRKRGELRE